MDILINRVYGWGITGEGKEMFAKIGTKTRTFWEIGSNK